MRIAAFLFVLLGAVGCNGCGPKKLVPSDIGDGCAEWSCKHDELGPTDCECLSR